MRAVHDGRWWVVTVPDVPGALSQVRRLDQVEDAIREAIAFVARVEPGDIAVQVVIDLSLEVLTEVQDAREAVKSAEAALLAAAQRSRAAARRLRAAGLSGHDAAHVMGISPQRMSQLTKS